MLPIGPAEIGCVSCTLFDPVILHLGEGGRGGSDCISWDVIGVCSSM